MVIFEPDSSPVISTGQPGVNSPTTTPASAALAEAPPMPAYLFEHFGRAGDDRYVPMCIAENRLVWDLLRPKLHGERTPPHEAICYDAMTGSHGFRERLACFLGARILGREIAPEMISVSSVVICAWRARL